MQVATDTATAVSVAPVVGPYASIVAAIGGGILLLDRMYGSGAKNSNNIKTILDNQNSTNKTP